MSRITILLMLALLADATAQTNTPPTHTDDFEGALVAANRTHQPVVAIFSATWCGVCRKLEATTLADPRILALRPEFVWADIDIDADPETAARYGVRAVPTIIVLDASGQPLSRWMGYADAATFATFLQDATSEADASTEQQRVLARVTPEGKGLSDAEVAEVVTALVSQLAQPSREGRDEALHGIRTLGARSYPALLALLESDTLALRAAAGGALATASGQSIPYDPFAPPELRATQAADWRTALATR